MINQSKNLSFIFLFIAISTMFIGCDQRSEYQKEIDLALETGQTYDSLIFDYKFGMSQEDFFEYSWEINKQGLVVNGAGAEIVEDVDWLSFPARRSFYPNFVDDKIAQFPLIYSYNGWAPWNNHLVADSLLIDVKNYLSNQYDATFEPRVVESGDTVLYDVSGNREIRIETIDEQKIRVTFSDLRILSTGTN
ncbi:MAG: hypothetical protein JJ895_13505 [Balneolaceae bacterium]|nr:hypothetical protein [Balneolaceae bacterium]